LNEESHQGADPSLGTCVSFVFLLTTNDCDIGAMGAVSETISIIRTKKARIKAILDVLFN
jgi:hypothetical protein